MPGLEARGLHERDGCPWHMMASLQALRRSHRVQGPPSARAEELPASHVHRAGVARRPAGRACRAGAGRLCFSRGAKRPSEEHPPSAEHALYAAAARRYIQERPPSKERPQMQRVFGGSGKTAAHTQPTAGTVAVVQPAPQRRDTLSAPLEQTPQALLRIHRAAPCVSAVQPACNWRDADFAPARGGHARDSTQGRWGLANFRPALHLLRGQPVGADASGGPH